MGSQVFYALPLSYAQSDFVLPRPNAVLTSQAPEDSIQLVGITIDPSKPYNFDFLINTKQQQLKYADLSEESEKLIEYFLTGLTVPEEDVWVNLSPYEKDKVMPSFLEMSRLGQALLNEDYVLKMMTASLLYPENNIGRSFWKEVYRQASSQGYQGPIPVNAFNKVWIMPKEAEVVSDGTRAFIHKSSLQVMMEKDALSQKKRLSSSNKNIVLIHHQEKMYDVFKKVILPVLEREINTSEHFKTLRQIYASLILAKWYKQVVGHHQRLQGFVDHYQMQALQTNETKKRSVYEQYLRSYKKGVFDLIKEEKRNEPRRYIAGGLSLRIPLNIKPLGSGDIDDSAQLGEEDKLMRIRGIYQEFRVSARHVNEYIEGFLKQNEPDEGEPLVLANGNKAKVILIPNLLMNTGQLVHIGLGQKVKTSTGVVYSNPDVPVAYVDSSYQLNEKVREHQTFILNKIEGLKDKLGKESGLSRPLKAQELRSWIGGNTVEAARQMRLWESVAPSLEDVFQQATTGLPVQQGVLDTYKMVNDVNDVNYGAAKVLEALNDVPVYRLQYSNLFLVEIAKAIKKLKSPVISIVNNGSLALRLFIEQGEVTSEIIEELGLNEVLLELLDSKNDQVVDISLMVFEDLLINGFRLNAQVIKRINRILKEPKIPVFVKLQALDTLAEGLSKEKSLYWEVVTQVLETAKTDDKRLRDKCADLLLVAIHEQFPESIKLIDILIENLNGRKLEHSSVLEIISSALSLQGYNHSYIVDQVIKALESDSEFEVKFGGLFILYAAMEHGIVPHNEKIDQFENWFGTIEWPIVEDVLGKVIIRNLKLKELGINDFIHRLIKKQMNGEVTANVVLSVIHNGLIEKQKIDQDARNYVLIMMHSDNPTVQMSAALTWGELINNGYESPEEVFDKFFYVIKNESKRLMERDDDGEMLAKMMDICVVITRRNPEYVPGVIDFLSNLLDKNNDTVSIEAINRMGMLLKAGFLLHHQVIVKINKFFVDNFDRYSKERDNFYGEAMGHAASRREEYFTYLLNLSRDKNVGIGMQLSATIGITAALKKGSQGVPELANIIFDGLGTQNAMLVHANLKHLLELQKHGYRLTKTQTDSLLEKLNDLENNGGVDVALEYIGEVVVLGQENAEILLAVFLDALSKRRLLISKQYQDLIVKIMAQSQNKRIVEQVILFLQKQLLSPDPEVVNFANNMLSGAALELPEARKWVSDLVNKAMISPNFFGDMGLDIGYILENLSAKKNEPVIIDFKRFMKLKRHGQVYELILVHHMLSENRDLHPESLQGLSKLFFNTDNEHVRVKIVDIMADLVSSQSVHAGSARDLLLMAAKDENVLVREQVIKKMAELINSVEINDTGFIQQIMNMVWDVEAKISIQALDIMQEFLKKHHMHPISIYDIYDYHRSLQQRDGEGGSGRALSLQELLVIQSYTILNERIPIEDIRRLAYFIDQTTSLEHLKIALGILSEWSRRGSSQAQGLLEKWVDNINVRIHGNKNAELTDKERLMIIATSESFRQRSLINILVSDGFPTDIREFVMKSLARAGYIDRGFLIIVKDKLDEYLTWITKIYAEMKIIAPVMLIENLMSNETTLEEMIGQGRIINEIYQKKDYRLLVRALAQDVNLAFVYYMQHQSPFQYPGTDPMSFERFNRLVILTAKKLELEKEDVVLDTLVKAYTTTGLTEKEAREIAHRLLAGGPPLPSNSPYLDRQGNFIPQRIDVLAKVGNVDVLQEKQRDFKVAIEKISIILKVNDLLNRVQMNMPIRLKGNPSLQEEVEKQFQWVIDGIKQGINLELIYSALLKINDLMYPPHARRTDVQQISANDINKVLGNIFPSRLFKFFYKGQGNAVPIPNGLLLDGMDMNLLIRQSGFLIHQLKRVAKGNGAETQRRGNEELTVGQILEDLFEATGMRLKIVQPRLRIEFQQMSKRLRGVYEGYESAIAKEINVDELVGDVYVDYVSKFNLVEFFRFADGAHCCLSSDPKINTDYGAEVYMKEMPKYLANATSTFWQITTDARKGKQVGWWETWFGLSYDNTVLIGTELVYVSPTYRQPALQDAFLAKMEEILFSTGVTHIAQAAWGNNPTNAMQPPARYQREEHAVFKLQSLYDDPIFEDAVAPINDWFEKEFHVVPNPNRDRALTVINSEEAEQEVPGGISMDLDVFNFQEQQHFSHISWKNTGQEFQIQNRFSLKPVILRIESVLPQQTRPREIQQVN